MVYRRKEARYRTGHGYKDLKPETIDDRVEAIKAVNNGVCSAHDLLADAEDEDSDLHPYFDWDDEVAGPKYRLYQARAMLHSYTVIVVTEGGEEREEVANVSVAMSGRDESAYMSPRTAMEDPDLRARIIAREQASLDGWVARVRHFEELAHIVEAIQAARAAGPAKKKKRPRKRPNPPGPQPRA